MPDQVKFEIARLMVTPLTEQKIPIQMRSMPADLAAWPLGNLVLKAT
jgi:hypothetical protein